MSKRRPTKESNTAYSATTTLPQESPKQTSSTSPPSKLKTSLTLLWHDIPTWQQDNAYITSGYRPISNSFARSAHSLLYIHNESVNIWTHLLGAACSLLFSLYFYHALRPRYEQADAADILMFSCFFVGAALCLGMSAAYHTISNHSEHVNRVGNQLDYVGIVCLIWGSFVPSIYYGFATHVTLRWIYWCMITLLAAVCITVSVKPKFRTPQWRPFRASMFVVLGLSAVIPMIHGVFIYGAQQLERQIGLSYVVGQGALYILGAAIYAMRIPEKYSPGTFDIWGSSHQIFHVLVLAAAGTHLIGLVKAFDYEHSRRVIPLLVNGLKNAIGK